MGEFPRQEASHCTCMTKQHGHMCPAILPRPPESPAVPTASCWTWTCRRSHAVLRRLQGYQPSFRAQLEPLTGATRPAFILHRCYIQPLKQDETKLFLFVCVCLWSSSDRIESSHLNDKEMLFRRAVFCWFATQVGRQRHASVTCFHKFR